LLRASDAIEVGVLDDAREAIEEIRLLDPAEPGLEQLTAQLAEAENRTPVDRERPIEAAPESGPARRHGFAAAALLAGCGLAGGWWWTSRIDSPPGVRLAVSTTTGPSQPVTKPGPDPFVSMSQTLVSAPTNAQPRPDRTNALATSGAAPLPDLQPNVRPAAVTGTPAPVDPVENTGIIGAEPPRVVPVNTISDERPALVESRNTAAAPVPNSAPAAPPPPAPSPKLEALASLPETTPPAPRVVAGTGGSAAPETAARPAEALTALPSPPPSETATTRSEEQNVRVALGRYELAYSRLDAVAAAGVWPTVNQRALASAFQGLSAQSISLGDCEIRVTGATARADCAGNARWTPKVGSGTQSAARRWRFDLSNTGGAWVITQATTR
jgi:hypothetical protein